MVAILQIALLLVVVLLLARAVASLEDIAPLLGEQRRGNAAVGSTERIRSGDRG